jgi:hypothetical protein
VASWKDTYRRLRREDGDCETSAVPMTEEKMRQVLRRIEANVVNTEAETDRLRCEPLPDSELGSFLRDAAILALL